MSNMVSLVKYFLLKDIRARYAGSGFGILWAFVLPVFQILLYWFVFSTVMRVRPYNSQVSYVYFLLSTYFFWLAIAESIARSGMIIIENTDIVKKVPFPNIVLPISLSLSVYLQNMIGVFLFLVVYVVSGMSHLSLFLVIPVLLLQFLFSLGISMVLAAVVPYMRDLQQVIGYILQAMFFLSPVIYSLDAIPERFRNFAYLNPLTLYIESYHRIIFERTFPGVMQTGCMVLISGFSLFLGITIFNKLSEGFGDIL